MAHSVGYCEDLYVVETADIKVDFEERGNRIHASMEVRSTVSIESSKQPLLERGSVEGMTETLNQQHLSHLGKIVNMKLDSTRRL